MRGRKIFKRLLVLGVIALVAVLALVIWTSSKPLPLPALPSPNGYYDFVKAGSVVMGNTGNADTFGHDELRALILTNAEALQSLRLGLTRKCSVPTEFCMTNFSAMMNELPNQKILTRLLLGEGRLAEMEGRPVDAVRSYVDAMRFGNEISRGGFMINRLVGLACGWIGLTPLITLAPTLSCEQTAPLIAELEKLDADGVSWSEVLRGESLFTRHEVGKSSNRLLWVTSWWQARAAKQKGEEKNNALTARLRLLTTELALRCYQSAQGHGPERLDELIPRHLKRVPLDPFSNRPLAYRAQGTNWLLYSVGADRVDNGGRSIGRSVSGTANKGDLLYNSPR